MQDLAAGCCLQNAETLLSRNDLVNGRWKSWDSRWTPAAFAIKLS